MTTEAGEEPSNEVTLTEPLSQTTGARDPEATSPLAAGDTRAEQDNEWAEAILGDTGEATQQEPRPI